MPRPKKFTPADIKNAIRVSGVSPKKIADHLGITPRAVYYYLGEYELWGELKANQELLKSVSAANITDAILEGSIELSQWVLERLGKDEGWTKRSEVTGADGESLIKLPPEVVQALAAAGVNLDEFTRHFTRMVQAHLEQRAAQERGAVSAAIHAEKLLENPPQKPD